MEKTDFLALNPRGPREISGKADRALRAAEKEIKGIARIGRGKSRTQENTLEPLNRAAAAVAEARSASSLYSAVHPDAKVRAAAEKAIGKLSAFSPKLYLRRDIYEAVRAVPEKGLDAEAKRFRGKELLDFRLTGVLKPAAVRREIRKLSKRNVELGQQFDRNIKDDVRHIDLEPGGLDGMPEDYRKAHPPGKGGRIRLTTQYPDYLPFMKYAASGDARKRFSLAYLNRAWPKNDRVLKELLAGRLRLARLLGFRNFADYATVDKMTGSAKAVHRFLDRVDRLSKKRAANDYRILLARKRQDDPSAKSVGAWESAYYDNLVAKEQIGFDSEDARRYFQFPKVKKGMLASAERLFGLKFREVKPAAWHRDVEAFDVYRRGGKDLIGRFYLDLHPRPGKYGHAACFDIRPGLRGIQLPEAALICNFSRALMGHNEVVTFFHEFGHLMHFILGGGQHWMRFSGFATEWDFVEAPSQMLEDWAFDYGTLRKFAVHEATGKPMPRALAEKMREAESVGKGIWQRTQLYYAMLSLRYHELPAPARADLSALCRTERGKYSPFEALPGTHLQASFGHLNGYSAIYYTYLWSRAIAEDILSPFKKHGRYDRTTAKKYVEEILARGGSRDARDLLRAFLGREWNLDAFRKWLAH